mmetsp:Transcript_1791/g.7234  ORF Transcript_1791/g.7234 Transcript_1791/m.7234 type:complete len:285 (-) Transcript_1791:1520-2374(-)
MHALRPPRHRQDLTRQGSRQGVPGLLHQRPILHAAVQVVRRRQQARRRGFLSRVEAPAVHHIHRRGGLLPGRQEGQRARGEHLDEDGVHDDVGRVSDERERPSDGPRRDEPAVGSGRGDPEAPAQVLRGGPAQPRAAHRHHQGHTEGRTHGAGFLRPRARPAGAQDRQGHRPVQRIRLEGAVQERRDGTHPRLARERGEGTCSPARQARAKRGSAARRCRTHRLSGRVRGRRRRRRRGLLAASVAIGEAPDGLCRFRRGALQDGHERGRRGDVQARRAGARVGA